MKRVLGVVLSLMLVGFGGSALAEASIGVLDLNKVMMNSPQFESAKDSLKNKFESREKEIVKAHQDFQNEQKEFSKNSPTMKAEEKKVAEKKLVDQQKKLQEMQTKFQKDVNDAQTTAMRNIVQKIEEVVKKIALEKKLDVVVAKAGTAYSKPELEITDEVVKQLKVKSK